MDQPHWGEENTWTTHPTGEGRIHGLHTPLGRGEYMDYTPHRVEENIWTTHPTGERIHGLHTPLGRGEYMDYTPHWGEENTQTTHPTLGENTRTWTTHPTPGSGEYTDTAGERRKNNYLLLRLFLTNFADWIVGDILVAVILVTQYCPVLLTCWIIFKFFPNFRIFWAFHCKYKK